MTPVRRCSSLDTHHFAASPGLIVSPLPGEEPGQDSSYSHSTARMMVYQPWISVIFGSFFPALSSQLTLPYGFFRYSALGGRGGTREKSIHQDPNPYILV